jgi:uncharacterized membrane protein YGL010W
MQKTITSPKMGLLKVLMLALFYLNLKFSGNLMYRLELLLLVYKAQALFFIKYRSSLLS